MAFGEGDDDDEKAWEGWEIEPESSDDSSDSGGWIDVQSDGEDNLSISDSDGENEKGKEKHPENDGSVNDANRTSTLATTKVCYTYV
jgi:protein SDA1